MNTNIKKNLNDFYFEFKKDVLKHLLLKTENKHLDKLCINDDNGIYIEYESENNCKLTIKINDEEGDFRINDEKCEFDTELFLITDVFHLVDSNGIKNTSPTLLSIIASMRDLHINQKEISVKIKEAKEILKKDI